MTDLPEPVRELLDALTIHKRSPAFLVCDDRGHLVRWGGALTSYGIRDLRGGDPVAEHLHLLHGIVPLADDSAYLPNIETDSGVVADLHMFNNTDGDWIVLVDKTPEAKNLRPMQQRANERSLRRAQRSRPRPRLLDLIPRADGSLDAPHTSRVGKLLTQLSVAVLEPIDDDRFRLVGTPPDWLGAIWPEALVEFEGFRPQERSPFLENFLLDAHDHYESVVGGRSDTDIVRSGTWTEVDSSGTEWFLEAVAVYGKDSCLLAIKEIGGLHQEKTDLLQRARDNALTHQILVREIEKKDVLLHCIVHDLRSPLMSVISCLQLMESETLPPRATELLEYSKAQIERQDLLIKSILDVFANDVRLLSDQGPDKDAVANCRDSADQVATTFTPLYRMRKVALGVEAADEPHYRWNVGGDSLRLERVMANLVDNALRHSRAGEAVTIRLELIENDVRVSVDDQGPGVASELAPRIFDRFAQGSGTKGHLGLGLHFCRITTEGWGGHIGHLNRREGGSTFWFTLPTRKP